MEGALLVIDPGGLEKFDSPAFFKSEAGNNLLELIRQRGELEKDAAAFWKQLGVERKILHPGTEETLALLIPETGPEPRAVVVCFRDHGEELAQAELYGFAHIACRAGVVTVCPQTASTENIPKVVEELKRQLVCADLSRVYAFGFGEGGAAALQCALEYPELMAGVAAAPGPGALEKLDWSRLSERFATSSVSVPVMLIGGTEDAAERFPLRDEGRESLDRLIQNVAKAVPASASPGASTVEQYLGMEVGRGYYAYVEGTYWYVGDFCDAQDHCVVRLMQGIGLPHVCTASFAPLIYNFWEGR